LNDYLADKDDLVGNRLTIADFGVSAFIAYAAEGKIPLEGFDSIAKWIDRLNEIPAWRDPFPSA
jgi:glutathione S-transferase